MADQLGQTPVPPRSNGGQPTSDPLSRPRVVAVYVVLALIVFLIVFDVVAHASIDLGVFATLSGMLLALLGLGAVVKLFGAK